VGVSILLNYFLTVRIGVMGPAWGGLMAILLFNALRFLFLWKFFRLQPFSTRNAQALLIGAVVFAMVFFVPHTHNLFIDVGLRSMLFIGIYAWLILRFRVSEDINGMYRSILARF